ncbi:MAG: hypothetical protein JSV51_07910 [Candidatus Bathyarchaeota archaeon]|nr:MAG: hypothetical protein JSV51_07910 [Candidatus Bathyarchaeota archaeon]
MPGHLQIRVKAAFGEVVVEGDNAKEVLDLLGDMSPEFIEKVGSLVSSRLTPPLQSQLAGIVESTTEGPVVTARGKFTHYEAIGLVLYASEDRTCAASQIDRLLHLSGVKPMVPARLNEMTKRGLVFKPDPRRPEFKLTKPGEKWIEEEVVPKLKESE